MNIVKNFISTEKTSLSQSEVHTISTFKLLYFKKQINNGFSLKLENIKRKLRTFSPQKFIDVNQKISDKVEIFLNFSNPDISETYTKEVFEYANKKNKQKIVDIGGGRFTPFAKYLRPNLKNKLIVIDKNINELKQNMNADKIIVADVNKKLPIKSADMVTSRYVLEHLNNLPNFISNSNEVLKKNGVSIHLFSCKFAIFSLLNQFLPRKLTNNLLHSFVPESELHGFKTNYNHCYYDAIIKIFTDNGFSIKKIYLSYYGSRYFRFFLPIYLLSVFYEIILQILGLKNLCAYILIVTKKE